LDFLFQPLKFFFQFLLFRFIVGFKTRWVALALAAFCVVSGALYHNNFADQTQMIMFLKNLAMAGGFLQLYLHGAGKLAVDKA
jgi:putative oxidoreductase